MFRVDEKGKQRGTMQRKTKEVEEEEGDGLMVSLRELSWSVNFNAKDIQLRAKEVSVDPRRARQQ